MSAESLTEDLRLLRAFEPVVRLTQGEFFMPVGVDAYVRNCSLWLHSVDGEPQQIAKPGELDLDLLAIRSEDHDGPGLSLSGVTVSQSWWARFGLARHANRPPFRAGHRLAEVGLVGRSIDTLSRLSLLVRGAVPGGSARQSLDLQAAVLRPDEPTYHGRVIRDAGYIVCQYWYFYSFNNWRSGFSGVNEHEADWEQVTVYLDGTGPLDEDGLPYPRWVVFSAHDEVGDDLRRRWDDPDLSLVNGRHPVVFAGAGSHSGAYLAGDYLITVQPPALGGVVPMIRRLAKIFTPWTRSAQGSGFGIPYIDYARGDGPGCGPGQEYPWRPVVIDDQTPWVRDFRGLWGHDTRDRFGGERGPAGPRYDRDATVRTSWADPVGWAGLAKVAPNADAERALIVRRLETITIELDVLAEDSRLQRESIAEQAAGLAPAAPEVRALLPDELKLSQARMKKTALLDEHQRLTLRLDRGVEVADPHAHLRHRRTPISAAERERGRLLSVWAIVSTPLILIILASLVWPGEYARPSLAVGFLIIVLSVEAFARGYFLAFFARLLLLLLVINFIEVFFINWQYLTGAVLALLALVVLVVNMRDALRH
ncbi:MAG: hypothetical protein Q8M73_00335 [Actinomycetota bacterium]|nr:hypothetical protein [Actinomycetota bacterium]